MKIHSIHINNFLGARNVHLSLDSRINFIGGKNGAGKTSIKEAVRMALTAEPTRVKLKKEYERLISEGEKSAFCIVEYDDHKAAITLPQGTHELTNDAGLPGALAHLLDAQQFAHLPEADRRTFLMKLMGVRMDAESIRERLVGRGCDAETIELIFPFLRSGFDAAEKEAASKARETKASWKTITGGETYGAQKAEKWVAAKPSYDAAALAGIDSRLQDLADALDTANVQLGELQGAQRRYQEMAGKLTELREKAGKIERIKAKLATDEQSLAEWKAKVAEAKAKASGTPATPCSCPECGAALLWRNNELLPRDIETTADPDAVANLPAYEKALALSESAVSNSRRDLQAAEQAAVELAALEASLGTQPDEARIPALERRIADLKAERRQVEEQSTNMRDARAAAEAADARTAEAKALHLKVQAWEKMGAALAPDGIRAEILAEALAPINDRLLTSSELAEWGRVVIHSDMRITMNLRDYGLLSESEQWRADAMIAEAIAFISGLRLVVLDRFDVLDLKGRSDALYWLDELAAAGEIDTALVFGTLKALPANLPETTGAFWIENGTVANMEAAA